MAVNIQMIWLDDALPTILAIHKRYFKMFHSTEEIILNEKTIGIFPFIVLSSRAEESRCNWRN